MPYRPRVLAALTTTLTVLAVAGCGAPAASPSPTPHQARAVAPGKPKVPVTPAPSAQEPPPSPVVVKVPSDQQDAEDGVDKYLVQTLDALPKGTTLDGTRFVDGPGTVGCDDGGVRFQDSRDVDAPPGTDYARLIETTAELWRHWGWGVDDADDQGRASRTAHTPDGYDIGIEAAQDPTQRPTVVGSSPCFSAGLRENDIPRTPVLEQSPPAP